MGDFGHEVFLHTLHFRGAGGRFVIVAAQMEETVRDIQMQFVFERCLERARLALRRFRADHDLAMLKRDDIRWAQFIEEAAVKVCNPSVGYQSDIHFVEPGEATPFPRSKVQALS
jgi:hypothetical protein